MGSCDTGTGSPLPGDGRVEPVLLEATGVRRHEREPVEAALGSLYDSSQ